MKLHAFGKIFSIIAMLTLVFTLTFALTITASAEEGNEPVQNGGSSGSQAQAVVITPTPSSDFKNVTFSWEEMDNVRYCVYVNSVHVAVLLNDDTPDVTTVSYTVAMKLDETVTVFVDAIDVNDTTVATGELTYTNHNQSKKIPAVKATCTKDGSTEGRMCSGSGCGVITVPVTIIPATGHTMEETVVPPTCTEKGYTASICKTCKYVDAATKTDEVAALGHKETLIPMVEPTCAEEGLTAGKKCTVCNTITVKQYPLDPLPHTWQEATCQGPKTCTVCSTTRDEAVDHKFSPDTNPEVVIVKEVCEYCGTVGKFAKVQIPPAHKDTVIKVAVVTACVIVIILAIKGLVAPPTTTPWWKRRRR